LGHTLGIFFTNSSGHTELEKNWYLPLAKKTRKNLAGMEINKKKICVHNFARLPECVTYLMNSKEKKCLMSLKSEHSGNYF
jgi:hypothetical protein